MAIPKAAEATGDLVRNKTTEKIAKLLQRLPMKIQANRMQK